MSWTRAFLWGIGTSGLMMSLILWIRVNDEYVDALQDGAGCCGPFTKYDALIQYLRNTGPHGWLYLLLYLILYLIACAFVFAVLFLTISIKATEYRTLKRQTNTGIIRRIK